MSGYEHPMVMITPIRPARPASIVALPFAVPALGQRKKKNNSLCFITVASGNQPPPSETRPPLNSERISGSELTSQEELL